MQLNEQIKIAHDSSGAERGARFLGIRSDGFITLDVGMAGYSAGSDGRVYAICGSGFHGIFYLEAQTGCIDGTRWYADTNSLDALLALDPGAQLKVRHAVSGQSAYVQVVDVDQARERVTLLASGANPVQVATPWRIVAADLDRILGRSHAA